MTFQFTCPSRSTTFVLQFLRHGKIVSIHVPLAEHDLTVYVNDLPPSEFQFTCPSRSTT